MVGPKLPVAYASILLCVTVAMGRPAEEVQREKSLLKELAAKLGVEPDSDFKETLAESELVDSLLALSAKEKLSLMKLLFDQIATPVAVQDLLQELTSEEKDLLRRLTSDELDLFKKLTSDELDLFKKLTSDELDLFKKLTSEGQDLLEKLNSDELDLLKNLASDEQNLLEKLTIDETKQLLQNLKSVARGELTLEELLSQTIKNSADALKLNGKLASAETKQVLKELKLLAQRLALTSANLQTKLTLWLTAVRDSIPEGRL